MNTSSPTNTDASSFPARKITRKELASHFGLCVRIIDNLTRSGVLGHFKIGKSIRYDLAEVEATLCQRFHVGSKEQPAASKRRGTGKKQNLQENLQPAIHECRTEAAAANAGKDFQDEDEATHDGSLRTIRHTSDRQATRRASVRSITHSTTQA